MENKEEKEFDLAVILTITTLKLFVPVRDFLKALKYITGDDIYTHQMVRVCEDIRPYIIKRYPELDGVGSDFKGTGWDKVTPFIDKMKEKYGATRKLGRLTEKEGYISIDPQVEAENMGFRVCGAVSDNENSVDCMIMGRDKDPLDGENLEIVKRRGGRN